MKREDCSVIIQGFGNVGSQAALLMHEAGYRIIGVADIHGGLYNENGFDIPKLYDWVYRQRQASARISGRRRENHPRKRFSFVRATSLFRQPRRIKSRAETQIASIAGFFAKAPTAPPRPMPIAIIENEGYFRRSGYPRERRRRHGQLFRMGPGSPRIFLAREGSKRAPAGRDGAKFR